MQRMRDVLKSSLGRSLSELGDEDRLAAAWQVVCGAALAAHGSVSHLDAEHVVHVTVDSEEWFSVFMDRRSSIVSELARVAKVRLDGIHFAKARMAR
ncbi:DciA family protein [Granulicella cerasi]|uniref:DciA family protein n=1 Tax=Granulicella cerasi TaxID=741063 RepID=A0ABW1Z9C3_9BACT|nr:DciA family protein [Granulicella cerasi]